MTDVRPPQTTNGMATIAMPASWSREAKVARFQAFLATARTDGAAPLPPASLASASPNSATPPWAHPRQSVTRIIHAGRVS